MAHTDPAARKAYQKKRYANNKAKGLCPCGRPRVPNRHACEQCLECFRVANRKAVRKNPLSHAISQYKKHAKERGHEYALDPRLAADLMTDNCYYCGAAPSPLNGIDRVDNSKGYTEDNVVTSCFVDNRAKMTMSHEDYIAQCRKVASRF